MSTDTFQYDLFITYAAADSVIVRALAEKLKEDGLRVWFDLWELRGVPENEHFQKLATDNGLKASRTLLLCMSDALFQGDASRAEQNAVIFRDPLDEGRRLIPVLLSETTIPSWLSSFIYADWRNQADDAYIRIRDACLPPPKTKVATAGTVPRQTPSIPSAISLIPGKTIRSYFSLGSLVLLATFGGEIWTTNKTFSAEPKLLWNPGGRIISLASKPNGTAVAVCRNGGLLKHDDQVPEGRHLIGHDGPVLTVRFIDNDLLLSGGADGVALIWDFKSGMIKEKLVGHTGAIRVFVTSNELVVSGSNDSTVRIWAHDSQCLRVLEGHTGEISALVLGPNDKFLISGSRDNSIRIWDPFSGFCYQALEGHTDYISSLAIHPNQRHLLSGSGDRTLRLWDLTTGKCLRVLDGHRGDVTFAAWVDANTAVSCDEFNLLGWTFKGIDFDAQPFTDQLPESSNAEKQIQYTNAKVLLVGESGAGKSSLSVRLATDRWESSTESTVGAWATQWKLPVSAEKDVDREIWLWDFGGQSDQRLIHQLYMADAALAVLVFNGQKDDLFDSLGQWDRDVSRASTNELAKILVAARIDAGGLKFSRKQIDQFVEERNFRSYIQTSARTGIGCAELRESIVKNIEWQKIPWRSSPILFKRLKDKIVQLKEAGQILMRFNDLSSRLRLELEPNEKNFTDDQLRAVLNLLSGPGVVSELEFGGWILFRPELVNAYGQALIRTIRDDPSELGSIAEDRLLRGDLNAESLPTIPKDDEQYILLDLHRQLIARGLCLRQPTAQGTVLVLPAFYRRRRPCAAKLPPVLVTYEFDGYSDEIHATLVVHLVHSNHFQQEDLWHDGADFSTRNLKKKIGIKFSAIGEGRGRIDIYANLDVGTGQLIQFIGYVHEHLRQKVTNVKRYRHYVCGQCETAVEGHNAVMKRLEMGKTDISCQVCEERVLLWDELEEIYNDPQSEDEVKKIEEQINVFLDNESKERVLVGDVISAVGLAGQIAREKSVSDHGIDMEIEFKDARGQATGKMVYLQLKSGDSHLRTRKKDGVQLFDIKNPRHVEYWAGQSSPVYLVIRDSKGDIEWMEIRQHLRERLSKAEGLPISYIEFKGERFGAQSILRARRHVLMEGRLKG